MGCDHSSNLFTRRRICFALSNQKAQPQPSETWGSHWPLVLPDHLYRDSKRTAVFITANWWRDEFARAESNGQLDNGCTISASFANTIQVNLQPSLNNVGTQARELIDVVARHLKSPFRFRNGQRSPVPQGKPSIRSLNATQAELHVKFWTPCA